MLGFALVGLVFSEWLASDVHIQSQNAIDTMNYIALLFQDGFIQHRSRYVFLIQALKRYHFPFNFDILSFSP